MKPLATRMAFGQELIELAKTRDDFLVCSADTKTCALEKFGALFPGREFSFGIAEQNLVGSAAGLASCGNKVFLATFSVFASMRACEQVRTFICYPKLNVTIIGTHVGLQVGGDGATHAAVEDVSIMRALPNMTIIQPSDSVSARAMAKAALDFCGPLYVRLHRNPVETIHQPDNYHFEIGRSYPIVSYGDNLTILVSGILLHKTIETAKHLQEQGIGIRVVEMPTIKPLDRATAPQAARETGAIMTVEDHSILGGFGGAIAEVLGEECPVPLKRIGIQDRFGESGNPELLYRDNKMDVNSMVAEALRLIARKSV